MEGSLLLNRSILDSQVFSHQTALKIWIWCLCRASYKERYVPLKIGKGEISIKLQVGQFIFGRFKAEDELGIDGSTIYRWLQKFSSDEYEMIKIDSNNQYSIITICNWDEYQVDQTRKRTSNEQPTNNQRTAEEQPTNTNNKVNKVNKDNKYIYGEFYDSEIAASNNDENYIRIVKALYGENNLNVPLTVLLKMPTQLSYKQFQKLWYLKNQYKLNIIQIFEKMQDWGNPKKRTTIFNSFLTFAKNENPSIRC